MRLDGSLVRSGASISMFLIFCTVCTDWDQVIYTRVKFSQHIVTVSAILLLLQDSNLNDSNVSSKAI